MTDDGSGLCRLHNVSMVTAVFYGYLGYVLDKGDLGDPIIPASAAAGEFGLTSEVGGWANDKTIYWTGDHKVNIAIADQDLACTIKREKRLENIRQPRWSFISTRAGVVTLDKAGRYRAEIRAQEITGDGTGLTFNSIVLVPVE
jgi:hypothetical protein